MLEDMKPPKRIAPCAIRSMLEGLDANDQKILRAALADQDAWSNYALSDELTKRGLPISEKPIRKHRRGMCSCRIGLQNA